VSTIYWSVYPSAQADPSIADVINGTVANAVAQGSAASPATTGTFSDIATGLSPNASYKIAAVWSDGTNDSALSVSAAVTTAALITGTGATQAQASTASGTGVRAVAGQGDTASQPATATGTGSREITGSTGSTGTGRWHRLNGWRNNWRRRSTGAAINRHWVRRAHGHGAGCARQRPGHGIRYGAASCHRHRHDAIPAGYSVRYRRNRKCICRIRRT